MIADKLLKSFYIVEVEGDAVETIFAGDFGINKILFGSKNFDTDLSAISAVHTIVSSITSTNLVDVDEAKYSAEFNPEFFPSLPPIKLTDEQQTEIEEATDIAEQITQNLENAGRMAIPTTNFFDKLGDFISSRWTLEAPTWKIVARVSAHPDEYAQEKAKILMLEQNEPLKSNIVSTIAIH